MKNNTFKVLAISRHRIKTDGQGITTLVALSSCPLNCIYCINKDLITNNRYKEMTSEELKDIVMQDYCYFVATNGGITFGGAEPLLQSECIKEFRKILKEDIRISIETSLNVNTSMLLNVIDIIDEFIIDIKDMDNNIYKAYTGLSNNNVLKNLDVLVDRKMQDKCRIRVPLIPNFNTEEDKLKSIKKLKSLGFKNIDSFNYILNKEM